MVSKPVFIPVMYATCFPAEHNHGRLMTRFTRNELKGPEDGIVALPCVVAMGGSWAPGVN